MTRRIAHQHQAFSVTSDASATHSRFIGPLLSLSFSLCLSCFILSSSSKQPSLPPTHLSVRLLRMTRKLRVFTVDPARDRSCVFMKSNSWYLNWISRNACVFFVLSRRFFFVISFPMFVRILSIKIWPMILRCANLYTSNNHTEFPSRC